MIRLILNAAVFFACVVISFVEAFVVGMFSFLGGLLAFTVAFYHWFTIVCDSFVDSFWFQWRNLSDGRADPKWVKWPFKD